MGGTGGRSYVGSGAPLRPAMTYGEYVQDCAKRAKSVTVRRMWGAMVRQVPGCSAARAEAIVRRFDSPLGFLLALEAEGGSGGLGTATAGGQQVCGHAERIKKGEELLAELACSGGAGTNKLPQPLRRLLCRLFVGESERAPEWGGGGQGGAAARLGLEEEAGEWSMEPMSQDDPY